MPDHDVVAGPGSRESGSIRVKVDRVDPPRFQWDQDDDLYWAVVGFAKGYPQNPVVLGFITPFDSGMHFDSTKLTRTIGSGGTKNVTRGLSVHRHPSGMTTLADRFGNFEFVHPSGLKIKIGPDTTFMIDALPGSGVDGKIALKDPVAPSTTRYTTTAGAPGGSPLDKLLHIEHDAFTLDVDASGKVSLDLKLDDLEITATGGGKTKVKNDTELGDDATLKDVARDTDPVSVTISDVDIVSLGMKDSMGGAIVSGGAATVSPTGTITAGSSTVKAGD